ncbi:hypothetical protein A8709_28285 [Paenibacillus pectinilyticus]|uniref:DUF11 domain-containing protein n=1 Tax=Paenibacillus pectinilyticus TaxID=512399 RepID=A0A1C0ZUJ4_9BACL|nr:DUF11 domain-containing protein [Paenibacillus pectinilyticus]OCT11773.1 hypothetical protein A8709_28285 [Paenibacillus pectinilyticus]
MTTEPQPPKHLINQSIVRFSSGSYSSHSYSNIVDTPVVGPIITLCKGANTGKAELGKIITYAIEISNKGNLDAQVTLFDPIPIGSTFIPNSVIVDNTPVPMARPDLGIPLGALHVGQSMEVTFQVLVVEIPPGLQLVNQANANYTFQTASGRESSGSVTSNIVTLPFEETKITFCKRANTLSTFIGDTVTFYFTITNHEDHLIRDAFFQDELSEGADFVTGSVQIGLVTYPSANPSTGFPLGDIPANAEVKIQFQNRITSLPPSEHIVNKALLTFMNGAHKEHVTSNLVTLHVYDPALTIVETVLQQVATLGDTLTYTIQISNPGNIACQVWLSDFLPAGTSYILGSLTIDGIPYSQSFLPNSIPLGLLQPNLRFVVMFQVTVNSFTISPDQKELTSNSTATFTFQLPDDRTISNRVVSNTVHVALLQPMVFVNLSASPLHAEPCTIIHYRIDVVNTGNLAVNDVRLLDWISPLNTLLPGSLRINGVAAQDVEVTQPLPIGNLPPRTSTQIVYQAAILPHPHARRLTLRVAAIYDFHVNEPIHTNTVLSNVVVIRIEHADE